MLITNYAPQGVNNENYGIPSCKYAHYISTDRGEDSFKRRVTGNGRANEGLT